VSLIKAILIIVNTSVIEQVGQAQTPQKVSEGTVKN